MSRVTDEFALASKRLKVKFLTEEEAETASIQDVVYPLPGNDILFPKNVVADWYTEYMKEDGITLANLQQLKSYSGLFTLFGAYRKLIEKPENISWSVVRYSEENIDLQISDSGAMKGLKPVEDCPDGKYKALILDFSLQPCTYATMALREIMKCETSSSFHAHLSSQHQPEVETDVDILQVKVEDSADNCCTTSLADGKDANKCCTTSLTDGKDANNCCTTSLADGKDANNCCTTSLDDEKEKTVI